MDSGLLIWLEQQGLGGQWVRAMCLANLFPMLCRSFGWNLRLLMAAYCHMSESFTVNA